MKRNSTLDLSRFILALFVVAIHYPPMDGYPRFVYVNIIARIADPLFFVISSYLFFVKAASNDSKTLLSFLKRIGTLYGIWCLIYSPFIINNCKNACSSVSGALIWLIKRLLFQGPIGALWFLPALMLGVSLCFLFRRYFSTTGVMLLSLPFYLFASLETEYQVFACQIPLARKILEGINLVFGWLANGLTFAFFFCTIGMYFAEKKKTSTSVTDKTVLVKLSASFIALFVETNLIYANNWGTDYWAMVSLIPVVYYLMKWIVNDPLAISEQGVKSLVFLQKTSILIFTMHKLVGGFWSAFCKPWISDATAGYLVIVCVTVLVSAVIVKLSESIPVLKKLY